MILSAGRRARNGLALATLLAGVLQSVPIRARHQQTCPVQKKSERAGNQAPRGMVATASNSLAGDSGFRARCSAPGVIKCIGFDSTADITGRLGIDKVSGIDIGGDSVPVIGNTVFASGGGSLKFTIPANSGANSGGSYYTNFSDDLSAQFDSGQEFYIQWRQRFSPEFITTNYAGGGGWKQAIVGEGDRPGARFVNSCTTLEITTQNTVHREFAQMYHSCGVKDQQYEPLSEPVPPFDFLLQNGVRNPGCLYSLWRDGLQTVPPCVGYKANQWMTFQLHVKIGTWYRNNGVYKHDSTIQLWVAEEGQPSVLVIDYSPKDPACAAIQTSQPACQTGYDLVNDNIGVAKYGKIWLLPYNTGKNMSVTYPTAFTWYDELIISRQRIPDPK